ncbi:hypothetical protein RHMOL_Rhmol12G0160900 [Rhododendron molle]|uniref:Uncharacterized protein n=1 Tax=Rhododendron molle TaxID=49168 RepID=A0ACC0LK18_RHOML|nr:hypothetical protein RHMOL_Rhmol12G0160900 [Rhododendron molle]
MFGCLSTVHGQKIGGYKEGKAAGMASLQHTSINTTVLCKKGAISVVGVSALPSSLPRVRTIVGFARERVLSKRLYSEEITVFPKKGSYSMIPKKVTFPIPRCSDPSNSSGSEVESSDGAKAYSSVLVVKDHSLCPVLHSFCAKAMFSFSDTNQTIASDELMLCCSCYTIAASLQLETPFGYSRKDVLLIGLGVTLAGIGLKSGLEFLGVDPLQAGNVVQLVLVLGLTVGWISTYIFRVSNKEMTYAQQLRDYENKVMEKRLEGLSEAELEALLERVEEEKRSLASSGEQVN